MRGLWLRTRQSWSDVAAYPIVASAAIAGGLRASAWWIFGFAVMLSVIRWDSMAARAEEDARYRSRRPSSDLEAYGAVLLATFCLHLFGCAVVYLFGRGVVWLVFEFLQ